MTRGKLILLLLAALIAVILMLRLFLFVPKADPTPRSSATPVAAKVTPISKKWTNTDREELEEWAESLEEIRSSGTTLEFDAIIKDGEMLVTDILETKPGVFHFTQLTPQPGPENGTILIKSQRLSIDLDGNTGSLSAPSIVVQEDSTGTISISSDDSFYEIEIRAKTTEAGTKLTGHVTEGSGDL